MNDYKVVTTKQEDREKIWADKKNISGSKIKKWIENQKEFFKDEEEFNEFAKKKMRAGSIMEDSIFKLLEIEYNNFEFIKDKDTYGSISFMLNNDFKVFANVDGFVIDNENNEKMILEIKNTVIDSIDLMFENYKYQLLYYCWFFNLKKALFVNFVDGWNLKIKIVEFTDEQIEKMEQNVKNFINYLESGKFSESVNIFEINEQDFNDENFKAELLEYVNLKKEISLKEKRQKVLKTKIEQFFKQNCNENNFIKYDIFSLELKKQNRKTLNLDLLKLMLKEKARMNDEQVFDIIESSKIENTVENLKINYLEE